MPPRKSARTLTAEPVKTGEPIQKAIVDTDTSALGIPPQPDPRNDISALQKQIETLRQQLSDAAEAVKGSATRTARQTEATVKLYPMSTLVTVAALAGVFAIMVAGLRATPPRSRYERTLDDMRDFYDRMRNRSS